MIHKTIVIRKKIPPHRLMFRYKKKRAWVAAKAYEFYIQQKLSVFVESLMLMPNLSEHFLSIKEGKTEVHIDPLFFKDKTVFMHPTRCDYLNGCISLHVELSHEDINLLKMKNFLFYDYYINHDYEGMYQLIREILDGVLLHAAIEFDYEDKNTYKKT